MIDEVVDKEFPQPEVNYLTYSVAYQTKEMDEPRWIRCVDWEGQGWRLRKGDRAKFTGYFKPYSYIDKDSGERKSGKNFVVTGVHTERIRVRHEAA